MSAPSGSPGRNTRAARPGSCVARPPTPRPPRPKTRPSSCRAGAGSQRWLGLLNSRFPKISGALPGLGCCGLRQPGEVGLVRRLPVKARMRSPSIVEGQVSADRGPGLADRVVGPEINLLVLDRSPEPLDEDVVPPRASAVHADGDPGLEQHAGEVRAGEL